MSTEPRSLLQKALGLSASPPSANASLWTVSVDKAGVEGMVAHLQRLDAGGRPALRGIDAFPDGGRVRLRIFLAVEGLAPYVCVEADLAAGQTLPNLVSVWPQAHWWQEEIAAFSPLSFGIVIEEGGALSWRRA